MYKSTLSNSSLEFYALGEIDQDWTSMLVDCSKQQQKMPSSLEDYEVVATIGSGSYGTCKKIRRKKDGKVKLLHNVNIHTDRP